jgi:segregation and condensation protein B
MTSEPPDVGPTARDVAGDVARDVIDITAAADSNPSEPATPRSGRELRSSIEALLVVAEGAVAVGELAAHLGVDETAAREALEVLSCEYEERESGIRIRDTAAGWRLFAAPEHHELIRAALRDDQPARLTQASLETLAVVAYRQPVTRSRIGAIRGVSADAVVRTLASRGLVVEVGIEEGSGAVLYGTSPLFLEKLGLGSLADLPPLHDYLPDLQDVLSSADVTSL